MSRQLILLLINLSVAYNLLVESLCYVQEHELLTEDSIKLKHASVFTQDNLNIMKREIRLPNVRKARDDDDDDCSCGPLTTSCGVYNSQKICRCGTDRYVIDGDCKDCNCANAICDSQNKTCECLRGYGYNGTDCIKCTCGANHDTCQFSHGIQVCLCGDYLAVNSTCDDCICGSDEYCYYKDILKQCDCTTESEDMNEKCKDCDCKKSGDTCTFSEKTKFCKCIPGYAMLNGKCSVCVCAEHYKCEFLLGEKHCTCEEGYVDKNGTCEECDCGIGHECKFIGNEISCNCKGNYVFHNGTCTECPCGDEEICEVIDGQIDCLCTEAYVEVNGSCVECFCGDGHLCEIINGQKMCMCEEYYADHNGTCEECNCGAGHTCEFQNGKKHCKCLTNHSDKNGVCEECYCGEDSTCLFENGIKICLCKSGMVQNNEKCQATCHQNSDCLNGGSCIQHGLFSFCSCKPGTSGDFCSKIDECFIKYKNCKNDFGNCQYNVSFGEAYCECSPQLKYDATMHICKECFCGENHSCTFTNGRKTCICAEYFVEIDGTCHEICQDITCNYGKCKDSDNTTFCSCDAGFTGLRCDKKIAISTGAIYLVCILSGITLFWVIFLAVCIIQRKRRYKSKFSRIEDDVTAVAPVPCERETDL